LVRKTGVSLNVAPFRLRTDARSKRLTKDHREPGLNLCWVGSRVFDPPMQNVLETVRLLQVNRHAWVCPSRPLAYERADSESGTGSQSRWRPSPRRSARRPENPWSDPRPRTTRH